MTGFYSNFSNFMMGISLMFFVFMSIRLFPYRKIDNMMRILFWSIILIVLQGMKDILLLFPGVGTNAVISRCIMIVDGLFIPMMGLFLFEAVAPGWVTFRRLFMFMLPVVSVTAAYVVYPSVQILYIYLFYVIIFGLFIIIAVFAGTSSVESRFKSFVFRNLSRQSLWVRKAASVLLLILFLWSILIFFGPKYIDAVYFVSSMLAWTYIYSLLYKNILSKDKSEQESAGCETVLKRPFADIIETDRLFLNPGLTLKEAATYLGTNRTYLSSYINNELHTTFNDYLNSLRVKEACRIMDSDPYCSLGEIAELSGFNSLSTFNRAFAKFMGGGNAIPIS